VRACTVLTHTSVMCVHVYIVCHCINLVYTDLTDAENAALMKINANDMLHCWEQTRQQLYGGGSSLTVTGMTVLPGPLSAVVHTFNDCVYSCKTVN
jgi:hypothetical protein